MYSLVPIVLLPYFGWGIYTLHHRFRNREEFPPTVEAATLIGLLLFFAFETVYLRAAMRDNVILHLFSMLGLFVSAVALYGHMAISFSSRLIVGIVAPGDDRAVDRPRFSPAEILERQGDWDGAIKEYLVLARIFPRNPAVHVRIGNCFIETEQHAEAAPWFERALSHLDNDEEALPLLNRLCELYTRDLNDESGARKALELHLKRFPGSENADNLRARIEGSVTETHKAPGAALEALKDTPLAQDLDPAPAQEETTLPALPKDMGLDALHEVGVDAPGGAPAHIPDPAPLNRETVSLDHSPMADTPEQTPGEDDKPEDTADKDENGADGGDRLVPL